MNQWTITGIDRETGKELMFCVEAQTHDEAVRQGGKRAVVRKVRKVEVEREVTYRLATRACFRNLICWKKPAAPAWACLRRWSALWARCRLPRP